MEKKYDEQFKIVFEAIRQLMAPTETNKKKIGFTVKEKQKAYGKSLPTKALDEFSLTPQTPEIWGGMLILKGICTRCGNPVARVIENE